MKFSKLLIILLLFFFSCENNDSFYDLYGNDENKVDYKLITESLSDAYDEQSKEKLVSILDYWNKQIKSVNNDIITNDTIKTIYELYQEFYKPFSINILGNHEWGNNFYSDVKYIVIQNKLYYNFDSKTYNQIDSIVDFRPEINFEGAKTLYLSDNYKTALYNFLGTDFYAYNNNYNQDSVLNNSYKKMQFLYPQLLIYPGRWGGYWHLETHPYINFISFNKEMNKATISFRVVYMFGIALMEKQGEIWKITSSTLNMSER